jgi:lipopolysaccharide biosynthesis glycosyltransferase
MMREGEVKPKANGGIGGRPMSELLPLLIATNGDLLFAAAVMLRSACAQVADRSRLRVVMYDDGVPPAELERFRGYCEGELGLALEVYGDEDLAGPERELMERLAVALPGWSRGVYARLALAHLIPEECPRAVYADVDVAVVGPLEELWSVPLNGRTMGAVEEPDDQLVELHPRLQRYCNSGVLVIDRARWLEERISERCVDWLTEHPTAPFPDQDALNVVLSDADGAPLWEPIAPIWNALPRLFRSDWGETIYPLPPREELRIVHYAGPWKPWNSDEHPLSEEFMRQLAQVPFQIPERLATRPRVSILRRVTRWPRRWVRRWRRWRRRRARARQ